MNPGVICFTNSGKGLVMSMNDKEGALNELYDEFIKIKWVLEKAGVKMKRIQTLSALVKQLEDLHINRIKSAQTWLKKFVADNINPWKRIRSENTEAIWEGYERSGFGNEFPEIKELNRCSKAVRLNWINRHNLMLKEKKEKKIEQGKTNN